MKNALVILAGGKGKRFGQKTPKQFFKIDNNSILEIFLKQLDYKPFKYVVLCIDQKYRNKIKNFIKNIISPEKIIFANPGRTRQQSSFNSLIKIKDFNIKNVLIHDSARPFCSNRLIKKILNSLNKHNNCIPYIKYNDRQLIKFKGYILEDKATIYNIQTPQGFDYKIIFEAHKKFKNEKFSDDSSLIQASKIKTRMVKGEKNNVKITYKEDLLYFNIFNKPIFRSGIGYDIHQIDMNTSKGLKLCGVRLPFPKLVGHSDADVGLHAICDSIFGALSMNDIGHHFPNTDKKWQNADSSKFVLFCREKLRENNFFITNLDINIIAEKPKVSKYLVQMKNKIAHLLNIKYQIISIKATTNEKIGFIGNGEGIAAEAIVQITNENIN